MIDHLHLPVEAALLGQVADPVLHRRGPSGGRGSGCRPMSGAVMFMIIRIVVVLPAPLGPSRPNIDPLRHVQRQVVHGLELAEGLRDVRQLDRAFHRGSRIITDSLARGLGKLREGRGGRRRDPPRSSRDSVFCPPRPPRNPLDVAAMRRIPEGPSHARQEGAFTVHGTGSEGSSDQVETITGCCARASKARDCCSNGAPHRMHRLGHGRPSMTSAFMPQQRHGICTYRPLSSGAISAVP